MKFSKETVCKFVKEQTEQHLNDTNNVNSQSGQASDLQNKYTKYYPSRDPYINEAIGLFYGGFVLLGIVVGCVVGPILGLKIFRGIFMLLLVFR